MVQMAVGAKKEQSGTFRYEAKSEWRLISGCSQCDGSAKSVDIKIPP